VKVGKAVTTVEVPGRISNRKGVSLPDTVIPVAAMTEKDRSDLEAALDAGVDWVALSFVQRPEDVAEVRKVARGKALVMSKLEKPQALARLDEIMEVSDGLMVARGASARKGAGAAEAHHPRRAPARQAGGRRDPDARIDDLLAGADPRRGLRRGDRRL
jgi:citrate lyase beta subunit